MTWQQIEGWFDFELLYNEVLNRAPSGSMILEVGTYRKKHSFPAFTIWEK